MAAEKGWRYFFHGVRGRATLAATLVVGIALAIGAASLLLILHRSLLGSVDQAISLRVQDVAAQAQKGDLPLSLSVPREEDTMVQVVGAGGRVMASSDNLNGEPPVFQFVPKANPQFMTVSAAPLESQQLRVVALPTKTQGGPVIVYVAASLENVEETTRTVGTVLLAGSPLLLVLVAGMSWLLVGRSLKPVESIRLQVDEISASALDRRVPEPPLNDEIGRLARTMNGMLNRLQAASDRQRRFVGNASHELQSPIASTRARLEVALAHPDHNDWEATAQDLLQQNHRMENLVRDLLFLARSDEAVPRLSARPVDLDDIVLTEVLRLNAGTRVQIDTGRVSAAPVIGQAEDLRRAVRNVLENALRFAKAAMIVTLESNPEKVVLTVEDDGPGIPFAEREQVFERFTRLNETRTQDFTGSGLGLAITKDIVEAHGGSISIGDANPGARVVLTLPPERSSS